MALEGSRTGRDLHLTPIRNENAYFSCISEIVLRASAPTPLPPGMCADPLYVIGDSHALSGAWRTVDLPPAEGRPERLVLVPCLVTGVKIYHLREKSDFYTKFAFWER